MSDVIRVSRALAIPITEITWRFTASGGPGGPSVGIAYPKNGIVNINAGNSFSAGFGGSGGTGGKSPTLTGNSGLSGYAGSVLAL